MYFHVMVFDTDIFLLSFIWLIFSNVENVFAIFLHVILSLSCMFLFPHFTLMDVLCIFSEQNIESHVNILQIQYCMQ